MFASAAAACGRRTTETHTIQAGPIATAAPRTLDVVTTPAMNDGLCGRCAWARNVESARGSTFLRCGRHDDDERFAKYPRLPVLQCAGFEDAPPTAATVPTTVAVPLVATPLPPPPRLPATAPPDAAPLIDRIGGPEVVARIVEHFYDRIEGDAELRAIFPDDLASGREKQRLFLEQWLGGRAGYSERFGSPRLRRRHFPFVIDEHAAGRWLHHMAEALRAAAVPEQERAEMLAGLGPLAKQMVNAGDDVPREPLGDAFLS